MCTAHLEDAYLASVINVPGRTFAYARDRKIVRALVRAGTARRDVTAADATLCGAGVAH